VTTTVKYRLGAYAGVATYDRGREQGSIGILPVGRVAWPHEYRLEAYATLLTKKQTGTVRLRLQLWALYTSRHQQRMALPRSG
jgi:hypothetical protein